MKKRKNRLGLKGLLLTTGMSLLSMLPGRAQEASEPWAPFNLFNSPNLEKNYGYGDVDKNDTIDYRDYVAMQTIQNDQSDIDGDGFSSTENDKSVFLEYLNEIRDNLPAHWNKLPPEGKNSWKNNVKNIDKTDTITYDLNNFNCDEFSVTFFANASEYKNFEEKRFYERYEGKVNPGKFGIPTIIMNIRGGAPNYIHHAVNATYVGSGKPGSIIENIIDSVHYLEPQNDERIDPRNHWAINENSTQTFYWDGYYEGKSLRTGEPYKEIISIRLLEWKLVDGEAVVTYVDPNLITFDPAKYDTITFEGIPEKKIINYQPDLDLSSYLNQKSDTVYSKLKKISMNPDYNYITRTHSDPEKIPINQEYPDIEYVFRGKEKANTPWMEDSISYDLIEVRDIEVPKITSFPKNVELEYYVGIEEFLENYIIPENLAITDNSNLPVNSKKSTHSTQVFDESANKVNFDFSTNIGLEDKFNNDTIYTHKIKVSDTTPPPGNLKDTYVRRESGQTAEDAIKPLIYHDPDNSGLPVDTVIEQTGDKYFDVTLKDKSGNENYLGNVEADWATSNGDNLSNLEKSCGFMPYPNPNPFGIKYYQTNFGQTEMSLIDMVGITRKKATYNTSSTENNISYDFDVSSGTYILQMKTEDGCVDRKKVVISK